MTTRRVPFRVGPVAFAAAAALAVVPALAAQERRASIGVRAVVAPAGAEIAVPRVESVLSAVGANGMTVDAITARAREIRARGASERGVRAGAGFEARVRWAVADRESALNTDSATVWVRDAGAALRPLQAGGAVSLGAHAGDHAPPTLHSRVGGAPGGRVELVYEIRVIGVAQ